MILPRRSDDTDAPSGLARVLSWPGQLSRSNACSYRNGRHARPGNAYRPVFSPDGLKLACVGGRPTVGSADPPGSRPGPPGSAGDDSPAEPERVTAWRVSPPLSVAPLSGTALHRRHCSALQEAHPPGRRRGESRVRSLPRATPHRMSFSRNAFCSQVAIGRAGDRNALRGRLTIRMVFLATIECRGKSRKGDGQWQKTRVTATRSRRMRRSRRRADYRPTSSTSRNPPRPIDTLRRFLLAMHRHSRPSPEPLIRLAS